MARPSGLGTPTVMERGAKIGAYGTEGSGKTELVMSVTNTRHLLMIDTEGRSQYYNADKGMGFEVQYTKAVKDALTLLAYAEELQRKGEKVAFAIDSFSSLWFEQQEVAERIGSTSVGTAKFQSWGKAKKPLKQLYAAMFSTPVDCIVTMRAKPRYDQDKKTKKVTDYGYNVADAERGLGYTLDLVVEMGRDILAPGKALTSKNFWALVTKTSGPKEDNPLPIGTKIKDPSFDKLLGLRLSGVAEGLEFDSDIGLQVALSNMNGDPKKFWEWVTKTLSLQEADIRAWLTERHGDPLDGRKCETYAREVWELARA